MKRLHIVCIVAGGLLLAAVISEIVCDVIPPRLQTITTMEVLKVRILEFAHVHDKLPHSLADLPKRQGVDDSIQDYWGRNISFEISNSDIVTLRSLGRDGMVGGAGVDADIIESFPARDAHGKWSGASIEWDHDPFKR